MQSASCSPPVVTVLQPAAAEQPLLPDAVVEVPKLPMPPADSTPAALEEVAHSLSHNQAFMQHLQQVETSASNVIFFFYLFVFVLLIMLPEIL